MKFIIYIIHLMTSTILLNHALNGYNLSILLFIYIITSLICFGWFRCITSKF
jgi:hypothetical protein